MGEKRGRVQIRQDLTGCGNIQFVCLFVFLEATGSHWRILNVGSAGSGCLKDMF